MKTPATSSGREPSLPASVSTGRGRVEEPDKAGWPGARPARQVQVALWLVVLLGFAGPLRGGTAYGSLNNFDTVNDTGVPCHGFEIELEDLESEDITYTYNWNHYGTPTLSEDTTSVPGHTNVIVRYASAKNPNGTWAAYTAVPTGPIAPTDGHEFTNPAVNFGGEHFGVGYRRPPSGVKYNWLIDNGAGVLVHGGAVNIATPTFTYIAPAAGFPARVQAVIEPPEPPEVPVLEFGPASWVKEIRTTTHNPNEVRLRDLVSDDPDDPDDKNWRNGEPDEVEVEWQLLQTEFSKPGGGENGELAGAPEDLPGGDEVVTRRYEFYQYVGPLDEETGEAKASSVGPDGIHGKGVKTINGVEVDLSTVVVVGDFIGSQMAAFDAAAQLGLIEHLQDGVADDPYPARTVVIPGASPFTAAGAGSLPVGLNFDSLTGVVSGTPTETGTFVFTVNVSDLDTSAMERTYSFRITAAGQALLPHSVVDTSVSPASAGTAAGSGSYDNGTEITVAATANPGFAFVSWTDNGAVVSRSATYTFTTSVNRSLVANFTPTLSIRLAAGQAIVSWPTHLAGYLLQSNPGLEAADWVAATNAVGTVGANFEVVVSPQAGMSFFRLVHP